MFHSITAHTRNKLSTESPTKDTIISKYNPVIFINQAITERFSDLNSTS